jgi:hypothetical protein
MIVVLEEFYHIFALFEGPSTACHTVWGSRSAVPSGTPASSATKTERHDIAEMLLKEA